MIWPMLYFTCTFPDLKITAALRSCAHSSGWFDKQQMVCYTVIYCCVAGGAVLFVSISPPE